MLATPRIPPALASLAVLGLALAPPASAAVPSDVPGLVAWYDVNALHLRLKDGAEVHTWEDSTPSRHDLVFDGKTAPPLFRTVVLDGKPVVQVHRGNRFRVAQPFELVDHTIFLVFATEFTDRALFRSDENDNRGVVLYHNAQSHQYRNGSQGQVLSYNSPTRLERKYTITVLGREAGRLRAIVNGVDHSSLSDFTDPIRVGVFFDLGVTKFVRHDAEGLHVAEMIFYDRFLTRDQRRSVTSYLSDKYAIPVEPDADDPPIRGDDVRVRLTSSTAADLNSELVPIEWDAQEKVASPFSIDLDNDNTAVICGADGTLARVSVTLPVVSKAEDAALRLLILKSGETYLDEQAKTDGLEPQGGAWATTLQLDATVELDAGDYIEVITTRAGGEGLVTVEPGAARLVIAVAE